jgi:Cu(I)/Ag(I) efflux system periplasmic protein CusF
MTIRQEKTMSRFKVRYAAAILALLVTIVPVFAQQLPLANGQVIKVDQSASKITIKHGPIKNLDMNAESMTMVFAVQDPKMLSNVKAGDKIKFIAERVNGIITVTKIQR